VDPICQPCCLPISLPLACRAMPRPTSSLRRLVAGPNRSLPPSLHRPLLELPGAAVPFPLRLPPPPAPSHGGLRALDPRLQGRGRAGAEGAADVRFIPIPCLLLLSGLGLVLPRTARPSVLRPRPARGGGGRPGFLSAPNTSHDPLFSSSIEHKSSPIESIPDYWCLLRFSTQEVPVAALPLGAWECHPARHPSSPPVSP
jgi:hypothetical protein